MKKRVLVTGGAGFIGSQLCEQLLKKGNKVICLDNFFSGKKQNIIHLFNHPSFEFFEHDIISPLFIEVDEIYHLACPGSPKYLSIDPVKTAKICFMGTMNMLELAMKLQIKVLQTSTSEIYGYPHIHPRIEDEYGKVNPLSKRACYEEGKKCAETLVMNYHRQFKTRIKLVRIFNTYGPKMLPDDGRSVSTFVVQALKNENITIYGNGNQVRSFCYVDDMVKGLIKMMHSDDNFIGPVNLGHPDGLTILEVAKTIIRLTHSNSQIIYKDALSKGVSIKQPDIRLAKKELKWKPETTFKDGLNRTIHYFRELLSD